MKEDALKAWIYLRDKVGLPVLIFIALAGMFFLYTLVRDWQLNRAIEMQNAKIEQFNNQTIAAIESANGHLRVFEAERHNTKFLVEAVQEMTVNVKKLAENDRVIELQVNNLGKGYEQIRNQKRSNPARANVPVNQREDDVLRTDAELYPN